MPFYAFDALDKSRANILKPNAWTLCVGAGICSGIMPDWNTITRSMLARAYSSPVTEDDLTAVLRSLGWSLDSLLQHALNVYLADGRNQGQFNHDLAAKLYDSILATADAEGIRDSLMKCISNPFRRDSYDVLQLEEFLDTKYGTTSLMQLARTLLKAADGNRAPTAVLTFNADVLLHVGLTLLQIGNSFKVSGNLIPNFRYRAMYRSSDRPNGKIPIYHIHGSITPEQARRESREKLVFPESSYSHLAGLVYAWPQTVFLSSAQSTRLVFVGLSMSDPNIRRWLSWSEGYRRAELSHLGAVPNFLSQHLWITTRSKDVRIQRIKESGLLHLGVRTAFIPDWSALEDALSNLAAL